MKTVKLFIFLVLASSIPALCSSKENISGITQETLKKSMCEDLDVIKHTFEAKYAPIEWKYTCFNWDLQEQIDLAKARVMSIQNITVKDYQRIVKKFIESTRDYHVGIRLYSTAAAFLPFSIESAEDRFFITAVDLFDGKGLKVGDEVLTFNGRPIQEVIDEFQETEFGNPESLTDKRYAEMSFTTRLGALGHHLPEGLVNITVRHAGGSKQEEFHYEWLTLPEKISDGPFRYLSLPSVGNIVASCKVFNEPQKKSIEDHPAFKKAMIWYGYDALCDAYDRKSQLQDRPLYGEHELGSKEGFLPDLGMVSWRAPDTYFFRAYMYKTPNNKTIGYIRIPSYDYEEDAPKQFALIMSLFNKATDALVIDQTNNPGGSMFYTYTLLSMLSSKPLNVPNHRETITQEDVQVAWGMIKYFQDKLEKGFNEGIVMVKGFPMSAAIASGMIKYYEEIISDWDSGYFFSNSRPMYGITAIKPSTQGVYTKPILVLVNSLDFSGGDFFPAILQDNKRATIFGTRTAGAGGVVLTQSYANRFGVSQIALTGSIAERSNGDPLENLGVSPDIVCEMTANDLQNGYQDYIKKVNEALSEMIKKK